MGSAGLAITGFVRTTKENVVVRDARGLVVCAGN